jgi:metal-dependent HD superfamily phosphatase/phosphodiesterase
LLRLVRLVDRQCVERNQVADGIGDADEERIEALLGEDLVKDVGEAPVRLDQRGIAGLAVAVEQPEVVRPDYHLVPSRFRLKCTV